MGLIALAVVEELTDAKLYEHEAKLFRRKIVDGDRISRKFELFAGEEKVHHEILRGMASIEELGQEAPQKPPFSGFLRETLRTHVERELRSIRACEGLLAQLTDPRQRLLIKGIMADEKEHLKACLKYLKYVRRPS